MLEGQKFKKRPACTPRADVIEHGSAACRRDHAEAIVILLSPLPALVPGREEIRGTRKFGWRCSQWRVWPRLTCCRRTYTT